MKWIREADAERATERDEVFYKRFSFGGAPDLQVKVLDPEKRVLSVIISTEDVDRDGDVVRVKGWRLKEYAKNPVVFAGHETWRAPIGRSIKVEKDAAAKVLRATAQFAGFEQYHGEAEMWFALARDGFVHTASVGYDPHRRKPLDLGGDEEDAKPGVIPRRKGYEYLDQSLLEWSLVGIPANPGALIERGWSLDRLADVARKHLAGSRLDEVMKAFAGSAPIILARPASQFPEEVKAVLTTTPEGDPEADAGFDHTTKGTTDPEPESTPAAPQPNAAPTNEKTDSGTALADVLVELKALRGAIEALPQALKEHTDEAFADAIKFAAGEPIRTKAHADPVARVEDAEPPAAAPQPQSAPDWMGAITRGALKGVSRYRGLGR